MPSLTASVAAAAAGGAVALPASYLALLSAMSGDAPGAVSDGSLPRLVVLVPAHDEAMLIERCVGSLLAQDYPAGQFRIVVVADNCTDETAVLARAGGADVLERTDPAHRGKGRALRWAMDLLLREEERMDGFVIVDADSVLEPGLLAALGRALRSGATVAQADYEALLDGESPRHQLRAAAFLLFHRTRFRGKARLGLPCWLVGNGMLISRAVAQDLPWSAFSEVEDLEQTLVFRKAGIHPVFVPDAHLRAPIAAAGDAADVQRSRWEGGRLRVTRQALPELLRLVASRRRYDLWDAAADLAVPPLGALAPAAALGTAGTVLAWQLGVVSAWAVAPWAAAAAALPCHVILGLYRSEAPPEMMASLRHAPALVASESLGRLRILTRRGTGEWVRTPR